MGEEQTQEDLPELTAGELNDLVAIEKVQFLPHASFSAAVLQDAGIPAITRGAQIAGMTGAFPNIEVCVPRKLVQRAQDILESARREAEQRGIEDAFETGPDEMEPPDDPEIIRMMELRILHPAQRDHALREEITAWLSHDLAPVKLAEYLAAAGLSREEASNLIEEVRASSQFREAQGSEATASYLLIVTGILMILACLPLFWVTQSAAMWYVGLAGLVLLFSGKWQLKNIARHTGETNTP